MAEHVADFEWRAEGEDAEVVLYAPNPSVAGWALEQTLPAAGLPGVLSPIYAAASSRNYGSVVASETHVAPGLISMPRWDLLLVADTPVEGLGTPEEVARLISRELSEVALPGVRSGAEVLRILESGAFWAAEEGLIEEEDLPFFTSSTGDVDTLGRRALAAGAQDWTCPGTLHSFRVAEILDLDEVGEMGLEAGALALTISAGAEDLGRLALAGHRERILAKTVSGDFGVPVDLPAAPIYAEEVWDLLAAVGAAANYATARAALIVYALRRALVGDVETLRLRAVWKVGGLEEQEGTILHRNGLAVVGDGEALVAGHSVAAGTGAMLGSVPPFGVDDEGEHWPWEEAGILQRWAILEPLGSRSGEVGR